MDRTYICPESNVNYFFGKRLYVAACSGRWGLEEGDVRKQAHPQVVASEQLESWDKIFCWSRFGNHGQAKMQWSLEQRKFCVNLAKTAAETVPMIHTFLGNGCLSNQQVYRWNRAFLLKAVRRWATDLAPGRLEWTNQKSDQLPGQSRCANGFPASIQSWSGSPGVLSVSTLENSHARSIFLAADNNKKACTHF